MKKLIFLLAVIVIIGLIWRNFNATSAQSYKFTIGSKVPKADVKMKDISGQETSLKDVFKPNGLMVMFSCNTCPYVLKNQDRTKEISKFALANNIGVILINSNEGQRSTDDSYEAMQAYAKEQGYNWPYVVDKDAVLADAFGATRTPEAFLFNRDQTLVYHGAIDDNPSFAALVIRSHLKKAIGEMVSGKEVDVKTSRSVGCTIKR